MDGGIGETGKGKPVRLDIYLKEAGYFESREKAADAVRNGMIRLNGTLERKPALPINSGDSLEVEPFPAYVGRGAYKLLKALDSFDITLENAVCLDVGSSTGGFTQVMLKRGAKRVYAVDTGTAQLAAQLREDRRVIAMEKTDIRSIPSGAFEETPSFCAIDVSFIPLSLVLPAAHRLSGDGAAAVALVKPQFEAGRGAVGKSGVVRDKKNHYNVLAGLLISAPSAGYAVKKMTFSPLRGKDGNIEYLALLEKNGGNGAFNINEMIEAAFADTGRDI